MNWIQIKVTCKTEDLDKVVSLMSMLDSHLMIEDYSDIETGLNTCYGELIDESILNADKTHAKVSMYVDQMHNYSDYVLFIKDGLRTLELSEKTEVEVIGVDDEDWYNSWKRFYHPFNIGQRLKIVPMWEEYEAAEGEIVVKMDSGMAFGSGTHETTKLCLTLIEKYMEKDAYVLDVGTGSGILAICESKLGAKHINAYDIDATAVRVAGENAEKNGVDNITFGVSDLLRDVDMSEGSYDFISANIVAEIIIRMAPDLPKVTKIGSLVCTSGIIEEYASDVIECMEKQGFAIVDILTDGDWKGILFQRVF